MKNSVSTSEISAITNKIHRYGAKKCGTTLAGGHFCFTGNHWKDGSKIWYVVPQDAYYKFGGAQLAACYGKRGADYFEYKTPKEAADKITNLILQK